MRQCAGDSRGLPPEGTITTLAELLALRELAAHAAQCRGHSRPSAASGAGRLSLHAGRGLEFHELRAYQPGDDIRSIDWRHTALRGRPYTKVFQVEHEQPLFLCIDQSARMRFGTRRAFKSVQAARATALLGWAAVLGGDRLGGIIHTGSAALPCAAGKREAAALNLISRLCAAQVIDDKAASVSLADTLHCSLPLIRPGCDLVVLSDFQDFDAQLETTLKQLATRSRLAFVQIFDTFESVPPPPGRYRLADARGETVVDLRAPAERVAWGAQFRARSADLARLAAQLGAPHLQLATHEQPQRILALWQ